MLLVIALALKTTCEEHGCFLGRYKGDEFGILLKGGNPATAQEIAEKLRSAVEKSRTEHKFSSVSNIVTLSIGLSSFHPTSMQVVMNQASAALASAQSSGCNKVSGPIASTVMKSTPTVSEDVVTKPAVSKEPEAKVQVTQQTPVEQQPKMSVPEKVAPKIDSEIDKKAAAEAKNEALLKQQEEELLRKQEEEFLKKQEEEDKKKREAPTYFDMDPFF